ncbi:hypothetical protein HYH03_002647 [Edaphochlamys debaryana]|uniref:Uncharacterized protein n=1 Tax=Edaphochlamys debaryana TaxID=47281 RepID=A0A835YB72_9CHLO|nr:hypothetical protein HYH03_002647 [Edaphochlamys debaryana]|eukprot:KAG2499712.1 hypothetical protein HYH03_002647 [Edaphochlamys debaryana]
MAQGAHGTSPTQDTAPTKLAQPKGIAKKKKAPKDASFVVWTREEYVPDGWHSYQPGETTIDSVHSTLYDANKRAKILFYEDNPWGLSVEEQDEEAWEVEETTDEFGCASYSVSPPDSETWAVTVAMVPKK